MDIQTEKRIMQVIKDWEIESREFISKPSLFKLEIRVRNLIEELLNEERVKRNREVIKK